MLKLVAQPGSKARPLRTSQYIEDMILVISVPCCQMIRNCGHDPVGSLDTVWGETTCEAVLAVEQSGNRVRDGGLSEASVTIQPE